MLSTRALLLGCFAASSLAVAACGGESLTPQVPSAPAVPGAPTVPTPAVPAASTPSGTATLTPAGSAGSKKAEKRTGANWTACHASYNHVALIKDPVANVDGLAKACADQTKMKPLVSFKGSQAATGVPQSFKFSAAAGHCYRAYAAAGAGVQDLDLLIKDSTGAIAGEDSTDDPTPVVLEDGAVCFSAADDATVVVSVGGGAGDYAVQVWSD